MHGLNRTVLSNPLNLYALKLNKINPPDFLTIIHFLALFLCLSRPNGKLFSKLMLLLNDTFFKSKTESCLESLATIVWVSHGLRWQNYEGSSYCFPWNGLISYVTEIDRFLGSPIEFYQHEDKSNVELPIIRINFIFSHIFCAKLVWKSK